MSGLPFVVYDTRTWGILRTGSCAPEVFFRQVDNERGPRGEEAVMMAEAVDERDFVDLTDPANPVLRIRDPLPVRWSALELVADGEDEIVLADLPEFATVSLTDPLGCTMRVEHDGTLEFSCTFPGIYLFTVSGPRWMTSNFEIEGKAA